MATNNDEVKKNHAEDPLWTSKLTVRHYNEILKAMAYLKKEYALFPQNLPVLILQGGDDKLVSAKETEKYYNKIDVEDKTFKLYEGTYHEVFSDSERESIFSEIIEWIIAREK